MWVALGPFDGEAGDVSFQKPKLLKPNNSYTVGRKDRPLLINNKKVSHDHCDFILGDHTVDDVSNPSAIPTLELLNHNKKDKVMLITRGANSVEAYPSTKQQLQHGDMISLISGVVITVEWRPLHAYSPPPRSKVAIALDDCASLGIKLLYIPHPEITHHLTTQYAANLKTATSLLTLSKFVKPEWLQEVTRLGKLPRNNEKATGTSLEDHCVLPLESKFRPGYSPSLLQPQKKFGLWEPNEERVNLFHTCRFICLQEKPTDTDTDIRETIHRGGGTLETFDIHSGIAKFHRALTRSQAKEGKKTVVVGDMDLMQTAVGKDTWAQFVAESKTFALEILSPSKLVQTILDANIELLFPSNEMDVDGGIDQGRIPSPLPHIVPNSIPEEPSIETSAPSSQIAGPPRRNLVRRVTSRSASIEPSAAPSSADPIGSLDEEIPLRPRRPLTRRVAGGKAVVTGLEDPSGILDEIPGISELRKTPPPPPVFDLAAPTPARSSRLKRRIGVSGPDALPVHDSQAFSSSGLGETIGEPPLKKFKALFEATNTDESQAQPSDLLDSLPNGTTETQTQNETQSRAGRPPRSMGVSSLAVLREEEEESQATTTTRGLKRRMESVAEDIEMQTVDDELNPSPPDAMGPPPAKKRAVDNLNAVEKSADVVGAASASNKPPSKTLTTAKEKHQGAAAGKPDTDAAFLKAIASTKRGKKTEDAFDREFNNLKISKPELVDNPEPEQEWAVLAEFGDDSGLRGNFMTVVELDLYRKDDDPARQRTVNGSWDGKPNFKKFKKKMNGLARPVVDLFVSDENDYGMGPAYWNAKNSQRTQTQTQIPLVESQNDDSQFNSQPQRDWRTKPKTRPPPESDDDHEEPPAPGRNTRKPPSRAGSVAPSRKATTTAKVKTSAKAAAAALFIHSDDDIEELDEGRPASQGVEHLFDEDETLQSSVEIKPPPARRSTRTTKAPAKAKNVVEDDSDDDAVFQGFKGKKRGR